MNDKHKDQHEEYNDGRIVEAIIIVVILGILMSIAIPKYYEMKENEKAKAKETVQTSLRIERGKFELDLMCTCCKA